jgi:hypothetical protein
VWDVSGDSKAAGTAVILFPKASPAQTNQHWNVTNGVFTSKVLIQIHSGEGEEKREGEKEN